MAQYVDYALDFGWSFDRIFGTDYGYEPADWLEVVRIAKLEKDYKRGLSEKEVLAEMEKRAKEMEEDRKREETLERQKQILYQQTRESDIEYDD